MTNTAPKNKLWIYLIVGLVLALILFFWMKSRNKSATATPGKSSELDALGITEAEIAKEAAWIRNIQRNDVDKKAKENGRTFDEQLRLEAIWYVKKNKGIPV